MPDEDIVNRIQNAATPQRKAVLQAFIEDTVLGVLRWDDNRRSELQAGFIEVGLDSLLSIELLFKLEKALGYVIDPEHPEESEAQTPEELADIILAKRFDITSLAAR